MILKNKIPTKSTKFGLCTHKKYAGTSQTSAALQAELTVSARKAQLSLEPS